MILMFDSWSHDSGMNFEPLQDRHFPSSLHSTSGGSLNDKKDQTLGGGRSRAAGMFLACVVSFQDHKSSNTLCTLNQMCIFV